MRENAPHNNINLVSINVEGLKSNNMLLDDLIKDKDIVCIQEHWLFNFDTGFLHEIAQANNNDYVLR